jgi:Putative transmembrane protein (PGPGW)
MVSRLKIAVPEPILFGAIAFLRTERGKTTSCGIYKDMAVKRISLQVLGWVLLAIGLVGLFLPLLPGIPLALAGLFILSRQYAWARLLRDKIVRRFPRLARMASGGFAA